MQQDSLRGAYDEVYVYTMGRPRFILQHVVDAFTVQTATSDSTPIAMVFGLVGLFLYLERNFSGREVQKAHMVLGRRRRKWPPVSLPEDRGSMTVSDVLAAAPGADRDQAIEDWCRSVWIACASNRETIAALLREYGII